MSSSLPLSTLRCFEAAARHLNFGRAAEELHVTRGAISQRIRSLEDYLGRPVFRRTTRCVVLTPEGEKLHDVVDALLARLERVVSSIRASPTHETLTVCMGPYFGAKWLSPRLERFWSLHPDLELRLVHRQGAAAFPGADVDIAILWGRRARPRLASTPLFDAQFVPVASPNLLRRLRRRAGPALIASAPILHCRSREDWAEWLEAVGLPTKLAEGGHVFHDSNMGMGAAIAGQGVALGTRPLVDEDLRAGRLTLAHPQAVTAADTYHIVCLPGRQQEPRIKAFRSWLQEEAAKGR